jgi:isopentenyldiphosphate isomerase
MDDDDELLDLVDEQDKLIGTVMRNSTGNLKHGYLRAAEAFIQNAEGKLWIPRRHTAKRIAPGGLDYSMGEHVASGEDYLPAAIRGFAEELNLTIDEGALVLIKKFPPAGGLRYFRTVYIYKSDVVPQYNPNDFTEYYWLTPQELVAKLQAGEPAKKSLLETAQFLSAQR